jgi:hypothetical protein
MMVRSLILRYLHVVTSTLFDTSYHLTTANSIFDICQPVGTPLGSQLNELATRVLTEICIVLAWPRMTRL